MVKKADWQVHSFVYRQFFWRKLRKNFRCSFANLKEQCLNVLLWDSIVFLLQNDCTLYFYSIASCLNIQRDLWNPKFWNIIAIILCMRKYKRYSPYLGSNVGPTLPFLCLRYFFNGSEYHSSLCKMEILALLICFGFWGGVEIIWVKGLVHSRESVNQNNNTYYHLFYDTRPFLEKRHNLSMLC